MSHSANVESVELIKRVHAALAQFGNGAQTALGLASMEILRVKNALEERRKFWATQVPRRQEEVTKARSDLSYARSLNRGQGGGCVEQELALRKAMERLREAEDKLTATRRWQRDLPLALKDYEGLARGLSGRLEAELRQSLVLLENKVASLEAYFGITPGDPKSGPPV